MTLRQLMLVFVVFTAGCASPQSPDYKRFHKQDSLAAEPETTGGNPISVIILEPEKLDIRGVYDPNDSLGQGGIMYSADAGAAGMLAQVLVHAAASTNAQKKKLADQQNRANKVLEPLQDLISPMNSQLLIHSDPGYSFATTQPAAPGKVLHSKPIFFVSQDLSTFSVKHMVEIYEHAAPKTKGKKKTQQPQRAVYSNIVEVIATPVAKDKALEIYRGNDGAQLKVILSDIYRQSLAMALADMRGTYPAAGSQQSYKFAQGDLQRFERGTLLKAECKQTTIRNLRGWLITFAGPNPTACPATDVDADGKSAATSTL